MSKKSKQYDIAPVETTDKREKRKRLKKEKRIQKRKGKKLQDEFISSTTEVSLLKCYTI